MQALRCSPVAQPPPAPAQQRQQPVRAQPAVLQPQQQQWRPSSRAPRRHQRQQQQPWGTAAPCGGGGDGDGPAAATQPLLSVATPGHPLLPPGCCALPLSKDKLSQQQQEYYVNVGAAVRALQADLPSLLDRQPSLDVFCEGVAFVDNISPRMGLPASSCSGREAYGRLMWSLRFHRALFFCKARVELLRMWEKEPGVLCVRWSARASPRLLDGLVATSNAAMTLDGVSEFHFNDRGLIMKHVADCVSYAGMQLQLPFLRARRQGALVPGLVGGSLDEL